MDDEEFTPNPIASRAWPAFSHLLILLIAVLSLAIGMLGYWFGIRQLSGPGKDSPDVGFARDMMTHHAQAVDMATLLRDRTNDPEMWQLALDILLTQQAQIGQMQGWLTLWDGPIARTDPIQS